MCVTIVVSLALQRVASIHINNINIEKNKYEEIGFSCDQCEYNAKIKANLNNHKQSKHEGVRYG